MGRAKNADIQQDLNLNELELDTTIPEEVFVPVSKEKEEPVVEQKAENKPKERNIVNCLRKEKVVVRHLYKESGLFDNPKHVFAGGMAENAIRSYCAPKLARTGQYVNVLTDNEKSFLEDILGLSFNALSIYKTQDNFWAKRFVRLHKEDNILDLSNPEQYIDYKILLANKEFIAPSLQALEDKPRATYEYVIISENEESKRSRQKMTLMQQCYREFGKIESDAETLKTVIEIYSGKPVSENVKMDWLQGKTNDIIQQDNKMFLRIVTDEYLQTKVLIRRSINAGLIQKRNDLLYYGGEPLCENGEESTINAAARFLNNPKHQQMLFSLQEKLN